MEHVVIGDVHGCYDELRWLVNDLIDGKVARDARWVFCGDLIHKGPQSRKVVDYLRATIDRGGDIVIVRGNHEEKHMRWQRYENIRLETGKPNPLRHVEEYPSTGLDQDTIDWLAANTVFYYKWEHGVVVHGGIMSGLQELPPEREFHEASSKRRKYLWQVLRLRKEDPQGRMVSLDHEAPEDRYWGETYDGRFGHVFFGHNPWFQDEPKKFPHATGVDLGCVHGNKLCAVVIRENGTHETFTVPAQQKYCGRWARKENLHRNEE